MAKSEQGRRERSDLRQAVFNILIGLIVVAASITVGVSVGRTSSILEALLATITYLTASTVLLWTLRSILRDRSARKQSAEIRNRLRIAEDDLSEALNKATRASSDEQRRLDEALLLSRVWQSVTARLDQYHDDAQSQGRRAFNASMTAMWVGFLITAGCGAVAVFLATTNTGAVVIGALGAVSAAMAGYVARTHLRAYEAVSGQLQGYFSQPVEASRYLSAERAIHVSGLPEDARRELMSLLVAAMVAPPGDGRVS